MKKLLLVMVVLLAVAGAAFAQDIFKSYNDPGNINVYASVGWTWNPEANLAIEYMIGEFSLGSLPFDWGVQIRGGVDFWSGWFGYGIGILPSLHLGLGVVPVEFYASIGACFYGPTGSFPVTFASFGGVTWWFSDSIGLVVENGYLGWYLWGVGVEVKL